MNDFARIVADTLHLIKSDYTKEKTLLLSEKMHAYFASFSLPQEKKPSPSTKPVERALAPLAPKAPIRPPVPSPLKPMMVAEKREEVKPQAPLPPSAIAAESVDNFSDEMKRKVSKILPHIKIVEKLPSDMEAQTLSQKWKQPQKSLECVILYHNEKGPLLQFLENIRKAVADRLCPCSLTLLSDHEMLKKIKDSSSLIVATESALEMIQSFEPNLKEITALLPLEPLEEYLSRADMKKVLWNKLCQMLQSKR